MEYYQIGELIMAKEKAIEVEGEVVEFNGDSRYTVRLDNGPSIKAVLSGKLRMNKIKIIPGDKVKVEMSPYDLTHGRISRRLRK